MASTIKGGLKTGLKRGLKSGGDDILNVIGRTGKISDDLAKLLSKSTTLTDDIAKVSSKTGKNADDLARLKGLTAKANKQDDDIIKQLTKEGVSDPGRVLSQIKAGQRVGQTANQGAEAALQFEKVSANLTARTGAKQVANSADDVAKGLKAGKVVQVTGDSKTLFTKVRGSITPGNVWKLTKAGAVIYVTYRFLVVRAERMSGCQCTDKDGKKYIPHTTQDGKKIKLPKESCVSKQECEWKGQIVGSGCYCGANKDQKDDNIPQEQCGKTCMWKQYDVYDAFETTLDDFLEGANGVVDIATDLVEGGVALVKGGVGALGCLVDILNGDYTCIWSLVPWIIGAIVVYGIWVWLTTPKPSNVASDRGSTQGYYRQSVQPDQLGGLTVVRLPPITFTE